MKYRKIEGYKYQLYETEVISTPIIPEKEITTEFLYIGLNGQLVIKRWYAWDGPSGPTIDTTAFIKASLAHDALYQLMRLGLLPKHHFSPANRFLRDQCIQFGMSKFRAWYIFQSVEMFGKSNIMSRPEDKNPVIEI